MSVKDGVCEFCGQVVLDGKAYSCYEATKERKSKTKLLKPTTALTNYSELANQANMKYPSKL